MASPTVLPTPYQQFIHVSKYARWLDDKKERESWTETVDRYMCFMKRHLKEKCEYTMDDNTYNELRQSILTLEIMPSMRALMTAGPALERDNTCAYNCAYIAIDDIICFSEIMFLLLCGCGVGFSVERQFINNLPPVPKTIVADNSEPIVVADSKEGWADALLLYITSLYRGKHKRVDLSMLRPHGAPLKTFGGRSSGPEPLDKLLKFIADKFMEFKGKQLNSIAVHDIVCMICNSVVSGGVRRSAAISLSNLSDDRMRHAKDGSYFVQHPHRSLANNSVAYTETPEVGLFMKEWLSLYESKSGERGIFNRVAARLQSGKFHKRNPDHEFGTNPCSEIILRSCEMCNLTEVIVRADDTLQTLRNKVRKATILGTYQATLTHFPYLRDIWLKNMDEERLLGVSLTGIMDNLVMNGTKGKERLRDTLRELRVVAVDTNGLFADLFGINRSAAITCVKPSGTVSQLADCSSGIHARHAPYYIRRVRVNDSDPLSKFMAQIGVPHEKAIYEPNTTIFSFPIKAPEVAAFKSDRTAVEQLKMWLIYQEEWCEHKPSITVTVKENEWPTVGGWVWDHFDKISGVAFLPDSDSDHVYQQTPYEKIDKETYTKLAAAMPEAINWKGLSQFESDDRTQGSQTLACSGTTCEYVDVH